MPQQPQQDPLDQLRNSATVTLPTVAKLLGISRASSYRLAQEGRIPGVIRVGRNSLRVRSADLLALLDIQREG